MKDIFDPEQFVKEFTRIHDDFDRASRELARTAWFRFIKTHKLFKAMKKANIEMEMLGEGAKAYALRPK